MSIEDFISAIPPELHNQSGEVFYSGKSAFSGKKDNYILWKSPGGDPKNNPPNMVKDSISDFRKWPDEYSLYLDEEWNPHGFRPVQCRIKHLFRRLGVDLRQTPSSNLAFRRGAEIKSRAEVEENVEPCWSFHEKVIEMLGVKTIFAMGRDVSNELRKRLNAKDQILEWSENNDRKWPCTAFRNDDGMTLIQLTSPSRAAWNKEKADPTDFVKDVFKL